MVKILIAEDESILRNSLARKLSNYWSDSKIVAQAENGIDALDSLNRLKPDVAFLDIRMGGLTGIQVVQQATHHCHIVFVTAFDQYAIEAFEKGAIDYLLKPVTDARLIECIKRIQSRLSEIPADLQSLLAQFTSSGKIYLKHLKIQIGTKLWVVPTSEVISIQASGRYVKIVTGKREGLIRIPLKKLLENLDPDVFWQIHRSTVININYLRHVKNADGEQMEAIMRELSKSLQVSKGFSQQFRSTKIE
ncbi:LytR/AlgR family response regulator transcription factor [Aliikangiella coralliicola]|uniref:Response regulator transcription factor n=1 Tax=Aliikangiella coralliicola TaxID=2592383 RepID=A0A545U8X2_9GAMM|nr:LytTR family DNA-binding domain-containing protein [Aliikangiella coralliicola]TQV85908.1 response regulator transcription factor [Aliikangiella coralliicola]